VPSNLFKPYYNIILRFEILRFLIWLFYKKCIYQISEYRGNPIFASSVERLERFFMSADDKFHRVERDMIMYCISYCSEDIANRARFLNASFNTIAFCIKGPETLTRIDGVV